MNQEEEFKKILWSHGLKIEEAAKDLGISKQTLYNNIRKVPLNKDFEKKWNTYIEKLDKKSNKDKMNEGSETNGNDPLVRKLMKENEELKKQLNDVKDQLIKVLLEKKK